MFSYATALTNLGCTLDFFFMTPRKTEIPTTKHDMSKTQPGKEVLVYTDTNECVSSLFTIWIALILNKVFFKQR